MIMAAVSIGIRLYQSFGCRDGQSGRIGHSECSQKIFHIVPAYKALLASLTGGILFGVALGILSGLLPAGKASKLDAAEAMRFE